MHEPQPFLIYAQSIAMRKYSVFESMLPLFLYLAAFAVVFIRLAVLGAAAEGTAGAMLALLLELSTALLFYFLSSGS